MAYIILIILKNCIAPDSVLVTFGTPYPWVPHPGNQPTTNQIENIWKKIPESPKKQTLNSCKGNYLHIIYIVFTTIYIAFTLY